MTAVDDLWYLADTASQQAAQAYHRLTERHEAYLETTHEKRVSRRRFRALARRIDETGAPYGAHTLVYRPEAEEVLLCRHEGVGLWVLPGGGVDDGETFLETAERELAEEAGVKVAYEGLGLLSRVEVQSGSHQTWGVLPIYAARARSTDPVVDDPDGEITAARWFPFEALPEDTRDRADLVAWYERFG